MLLHGFSDGGTVWFLGAEVGISTQKLHARGPLGLQEITSTKYMIYGNWTSKELRLPFFFMKKIISVLNILTLISALTIMFSILTK